MSIKLHINLGIAVSGPSVAAAQFGVPIFVVEHTVTANRQDGPYLSMSALETDGFTLAAAPEVYNWANTLFAQRPGASQAYIGRREVDENLAVGLSAIEAVDPATFYAINMAVNTPAEIMALATWTESRSKIAMAQTSSTDALAGTASTAQQTTFPVGGTATSGVYSIAVIDTWTGASLGTASVTADVPGTHPDNDAIATALRAAWDAVPNLAAVSDPAGGTGSDVDIDFTGLGNLYDFVLTAPSPGTLTETDTPGIQNPAELLSAGGFDRTALVYHDNDTEYLDAAWCGRCLGFNLDAPNGAGVWAYHQLRGGITATRLTDPQKAQLLADSCNYYSPVRATSGVESPGFTWPGKMASGRFIDITTTIDLLQARLEEALLGVFLAAAASNQPKIPYTQVGADRLQTASLDVFQALVRAGHFIGGAASEITGRITPWVDVPDTATISAAIRESRDITIQAEATFSSAIQSVGSPTTVGFSIVLRFA